MKKYSVKEIIEMKKAGIHDDIIVAINKKGLEVAIEDVVALQEANFTDDAIIDILIGEEVTATVEKKPTGTKAFSVNVKDYEPKKDGSNYHWGSYKAKCKAYCYAVASKGVTNCYKKDAVDFDNDEFKTAYDAAKAATTVSERHALMAVA